MFWKNKKNPSKKKIAFFSLQSSLLLKKKKKELQYFVHPASNKGDKKNNKCFQNGTN